jgi:hypothetical protein
MERRLDFIISDREVNGRFLSRLVPWSNWILESLIVLLCGACSPVARRLGGTERGWIGDSFTAAS